jgi:exonuclease SbcD
LAETAGTRWSERIHIQALYSSIGLSSYQMTLTVPREPGTVKLGVFEDDMFRLAHLSDLHYCPQFLDEVDRCTAAALEGAKAEQVDAIFMTGDQFDRHVGANSPALLRFSQRVRDAVDYAPLFMLQGTLSHDEPGTVSLFRFFGGRHPIHVSERIEQVAWDGESWIASEGYKFDRIPEGARLLVTSLPAVNRAEVAARVGAINVLTQTQDLVYELLKSFGQINAQANAAGIPTVLATHGTVTGSITEQGVPMAGLDHEFSLAGLYASEARAIMLGHIHKYQSWPRGQQCIAYAGSIGRLHFGEQGDKGWLLWDIGETATHTQRITPARVMREFTYPGQPDLHELKREAPTCAGQHVRIRYALDEEYRHEVNRNEILSWFETAHLVKIEPRINPILRSRTEGMAKDLSLSTQLGVWAKATGTADAGLHERLATLTQQSPDDIVSQLVGLPAVASTHGETVAPTLFQEAA